ncbi:ribonucleases P/MRP protein subunit POP1-domain-containing protein [Ilyonectria robusta]|uniref:ribonucleases P/MRP protein subunit POP1-domain-containing protein n=1 Tax=Ilyonectria robusta TaxID=1079257 RepID=UPI001E8D281A|nr:ribonucleases P/MRP protein subunit POP1-domain-containing protein [Ilyonectria robusta]KAH8676967.1 ribonucleases P/MRP protein subunit POP1-domain-containing protein [Ilyonectria robusta]
MASSSASADAGRGAKRKPGAPANNARTNAANTQSRSKLVHIARAIPTQPADAALKDGELDLQAFLAAHEFEIRSLEQSMATSKAVSSSRAFQKVPRGLRRRTASHNPKRVPRRLRARARREMAEDNTPMVDARKKKRNPRTTRGRIRVETAKRLGVLAARKRRAREMKPQEMEVDGKDTKALAVTGRKPRPKIRRNQLNEPPTPKARFRKRQLNKTWLPTHPWHAKRSRMTGPLDPLWRFAIPLTPNEKLYRPTHRAQGDRGTLVWDTSYMSTIGLYGSHTGIETVLKKIGVSQDSCWNAKGRKWRIGTRSWTGLVSRHMDGEQRLIGPSTIQWNPQQSAGNATEDPKKAQRQVFLRVHPAAFLELFNELLRLSKIESPQLYIEDLRFEIGSIELTGPASTEALLAVLNPYPEKDKTKSQHAELFRSLAGLTNPASLPAGAILSFSVQDPRLRYPPRQVVASDEPETQLELLEKIATWPSEDNLEPFPIFSRDARHTASCLPSQKSINRRKADKTENAPGVPLKPTAADHPIPITLIASRTSSSTQAQGTWTLLAPWKCILPIWYSIVHVPLSSGGNPRFAGLNQTRQVAFERGLPWFPGDFLGTDAGAQWELDERQKRQKLWDRRPKSKRVEWTSLDLGAGRKGEVGSGIASDFEFLFELANSVPATQPESTEGDAEAMDIDEIDAQEPPSLQRLNQISKDLFNKFITSATPPSPPPTNAIVTVRISVLGRGVVTSCARIYRLPSSPTAVPPSSEAEVPATIPPEASPKSSSLPHDLRAQWLARVSPSTSGKDRSSRTHKARDLESLKRQLALELIAKPSPYPPLPANQYDVGGHPLVPDTEDLIGFVTTGSFCLSEGRGVAIGSIALEKIIADVRKDPKEGRFCVVRNAGENVGWIAKWEVV